MAATREAAKRAVRHRTQGDSTERERLYSLLKRNRRTEASFRHKRMRKSWRGGRSDVTNRIVADAGSCIARARTGMAVSAKSRTRPAHDHLLKGTHLPFGTLRILLQNNGQVELHHAVDEEQVCSARPRGQAMVGVDKGYTESCTDSEGEHYGEGLGDRLSAGSDHRKVREWYWPGIHGRLVVQLHDARVEAHDPGSINCSAFYNSQQRCR